MNLSYDQLWVSLGMFQVMFYYKKSNWLTLLQRPGRHLSSRWICGILSPRMAHAVDQGNSKQPRFPSAYPRDGSVGPRASQETDGYCASAANLPVTDYLLSWCRLWWCNSSGMSAKRLVAPSASSVKLMAPGYWSFVATSLRQTHAPSSPCKPFLPASN